MCVDDVCVEICTLAPDSCLPPLVCTNPNDGISIGPSDEYGICL